MKIADLASEPKLVRVVIADKDIVEQYGDELEFWVWDRQPIEKFLKFAGKTITEDDLPELVAFTREMILDEEGNTVVTGGKMLPTTIMTRCITRVMEQLGKS